MEELLHCRSRASYSVAPLETFKPQEKHLYADHDRHNLTRDSNSSIQWEEGLIADYEHHTQSHLSKIFEQR